MNKIIGIIPARYASTRLPGKPLKDICGKPMLLHVYERVKMAKKLSAIYAAIDDYKIEDMCKQYNIPYIMTSPSHKTAAHRLNEVSEKVEGDYFIQINGDEPLIDHNLIDLVVPENIPNEYPFGSNIISKINSTVELMDPSNIKVVYNNDEFMVYMSRYPIPFPQGTLNFDYYKHVGIIGFNKKMLDFYYNSVPGIYEKIEGIDTLRFIDYHIPLKIFRIDEYKSLSVDTEKDLEKVRKIIAEEMKNE